jgi:hypothetical protein
LNFVWFETPKIFARKINILYRKNYIYLLLFA